MVNAEHRLVTADSAAITQRSAPDFLFVGTSKAGSTWLFNALALHPDVYLASNKGLYYFDRHFERGEQWYLSQFAGRHDQRVAGEVSHSYLSSPEAPRRIAALNPAMRLLACLREPVDRAFSDYLDLLKNNLFAGSFEAALEHYPRLIERGYYAEHLQRYAELFPSEQICVQLFDDLRDDPQRHADRAFAFLGVARLELPGAALRSRMPAGSPRSLRAASAAKAVSKAIKRAGLRRLRSRVKRSTTVRHVLYRPFTDDRPTLGAETAARLRAGFAPDVARLDALLNQPISERWAYPPSGR